MLSDVLDAGYFDMIKQKTYDVIFEERNQYKIVWDTIEEYCKEHKLIISDKYRLCGKNNELIPIHEKYYRIYALNPFLHTNELTNLIHKTMNIDEMNKGKDEVNMSIFTSMMTVSEQKEFTISYGLRTIATLYKIQRSTKSGDINVYKLLLPVQIDGIYYMPAEVEIIEVYHNLYKYIDYDKSLELEMALFAQIEDRFEKGMYKKISGGCDENDMTMPEYDYIHRDSEWRAIVGGDIKYEYEDAKPESCKVIKKNLLEQIKISIVIDWLPNRKDTILVGQWAYNWVKLGKNICADRNKIQLISMMSPQELLVEIRNYINQLYNASLSLRENILETPKDFRLRRSIYYMVIASEYREQELEFMELYNNASFEVVPYHIKDHIFIASDWVQLRFAFIDLWIIRYIKTTGQISNERLDERIDKLWHLIAHYRSSRVSSINIMASTDFTPSFSDTYHESVQEHYLGIYRDVIVDKKINDLRNKIGFYPYHPFMFYRKNGYYRKI